jgi:anti-sigma factor ChrR (cupin superfamily)
VVIADRTAALLRYQPGASLARHAHEGHEYILCPAGSFMVNRPGSGHSVHSDEG